jgi:hypothetical protein
VVFADGNAPACDRLAATGDPLEVKAILNEAMLGLLAELQELPNRIDPAEWAEFLPREKATAPRSPGAASRNDWLPAPAPHAQGKAKAARTTMQT